MLDFALQGFAYLTPSVLLFMVIGVFVCQLLVVLPGLGGHFVLVMLLPFLHGMEPMHALAMIVGASVTTGTGNTITGVLFGVPGSPTGVATTFDGYPMARKGQGARAVAAGLAGSAAGGIIGAVALAIMLPSIRPVVLALSAPEYFTLILAAILAMGYLAQQDTLKALIAGGLGFLLSFVGMEDATGVVRYTFGWLPLFDGINLAAAFIGLFAVSEMMDLMRQGGSIAGDKLESERGTLAGILDVLRNRRATVISSLTGVVVGVIPGMGGGASQFLAYTNVARTSKRKQHFGTGEVEGVIAADASVNATDAGMMVPTVGFGIPGSATAAILLAGLMAVGVQPGPQMLLQHMDILWLIVFVLVVANVVATALCISISGWLARLTTIPIAFLVPTILTVAMFAAFWSLNAMAGIVIAVVFGVLGYVMKLHGYSRATMVIGFVLGGIMERYYVLAQELYGWAFVQRPITLAIITVLATALVWPFIARLWRSRRTATERSEP